MSKEYPYGTGTAIALIRVSSKGQEENTSLVGQRQDIEEYAKAESLKLVDIVEIVESAKSSGKRLGYSDFKNRAKRLKAGHIIFHRYDRESRNLTDNEVNEEEVRSGAICLHYALDKKILHKNSPDSEFLTRDIHAAINKGYSRELSTKVRRGMRLKAEQGWYPGTNVPLGYVHLKKKNSFGVEKQKGTIIVRDPRENKVKAVQREFEMRAELPTPTLKQIRDRVILEGLIPDNEIKKYQACTIEKRLKNVFYDGRFTWDRKEFPGNHERIISASLFKRVQETFGKRNPYGKQTMGIFRNGWLKCGEPLCGCNVIYDSITKKVKATGEMKTYHYYHCTNGKRIHVSLAKMRVNEEKLLDQFRPAVQAISIREDFRDELLAAINDAQINTRRAIKADIENYREALIALQGKENRAYDRFDRGEIDRETYNQQRARIQKEHLDYSEKMEKAQLGINDISNETVKTILQLVTNAETLWNRRSPPEKRDFLEKILSNQTFDGVSARYEIVKPLHTLSKMKENVNWRDRIPKTQTAEPNDFS